MLLYHLSILLSASIVVVIPIQASSVSERTTYPNFCQLATIQEDIFLNFRQAAATKWIVETVSYEEGWAMLQYIAQEHPHLVPFLEKISKSDKLGNPTVYNYPPFGSFCPTTLRYVKIAGDLQREFTNLSSLNILEIGGGYGGQCKILNDIEGFSSYTIVDLPECTPLIAKYLNCHQLTNTKCIDSVNVKEEMHCDLLISNYAFSELDKIDQLNYINLIIDFAPMGYMTYNLDPSAFNNINSLTVDEVRAALSSKNRTVKVEPENPPTGEHTFVIIWY